MLPGLVELIAISSFIWTIHNTNIQYIQEDQNFVWKTLNKISLFYEVLKELVIHTETILGDLSHLEYMLVVLEAHKTITWIESINKITYNQRKVMYYEVFVSFITINNLADDAHCLQQHSLSPQQEHWLYLCFAGCFQASPISCVHVLQQECVMSKYQGNRAADFFKTWNLYTLPFNSYCYCTCRAV